jgi:hypothetical protein
MMLIASSFFQQSQTNNNEAASVGTKALPVSLPWWVRMRFCFSRAKWGELVKLLERHNDNIARLLEGSEGRFAAAAWAANNDKKHQLEADVLNVRSSVCKIHKAVARGWRCGCLVRHRACITLHDGRISEVGKHYEASLMVPSLKLFHLLFRYGSYTGAPQFHPWDTIEGKLQLVTASPSQPSTGTQLSAQIGSTSSSLPTSSCAVVTPDQDCAKPPLSLGAAL